MKRTVSVLLLAALFLMPVNSPASEMSKAFNKDLPKWLELLKKGDSREKRLVLQSLDSIRYREYRQNDAYSQVLKELNDKDPSVRAEAAALLKFVAEYSEACCRETGVVAALTKALTDDNPRVRAVSAAALAYYKDSSTLKPLLKSIKDPDPWVRVDAVYALGELGGAMIQRPLNADQRADLSRAYDDLLDMLDDDRDWRNKFVQKDAIIAIAKITGFDPGNRTKSEPILLRKADDRYLRLEIIRALHYGASARCEDTLLAAAMDNDELVRLAAYDAIVNVHVFPQIPPPSWTPFQGPSESNDAFQKRAEEYKRKVAEYNEKVRVEKQRIIDRRAQVFIEGLRHPSGKVRSKAIEVLGFSEYAKKALPALADFIASNGKESDLAEKKFMARAETTASKKTDRKNYKVLVNEDAATALLKAFDRAAANRTKLVFMLGSFADKRVEDKLREVLNDPSPEVRRLASEALDKVTLSGPWEVYSRELKSSDVSARETAASELGKLGDRRAVEPLIDALGDADAGVRKAAASALGDLRDSRAAWPLIRLLKDPDPKVRSIAAVELSGRQLVDGRDTSMIEPLMDALHDDDYWVKGPALNALANFGDPRAEDAALDMLKDKSVSRNAVFVLGKMKSAKGVLPLISILGDPRDDVAPLSAEALGKIGDARAVDPLIDALMDKFKGQRALNYNVDLRANAAKSLGLLKAQKAVPYLLKVFLNQDDPSHVRFSALTALGDIGDPSAIEPLKSKLSEGKADSDFTYFERELRKTVEKLEKEKGR